MPEIIAKFITADGLIAKASVDAEIGMNSMHTPPEWDRAIRTVCGITDSHKFEPIVKRTYELVHSGKVWQGRIIQEPLYKEKQP